MIAEVISIGDELTSGQRLDTNCQWLSERLGEFGIRVLFHSTVGDDLDANIQVFRQAAQRSQVIVCTGGLGPTADDLTRQSIADATQTELELDEGALSHIKSLFARRKREMPESNVIQAMFPQGSRIIPNPHGSAPGIDMDVTINNQSPARVFALPGVPAEMKEMWFGYVEEHIGGMLGGDRHFIRHYRIKCFGAGESDLEQMLPDLIRRGRQPSVGITVSKATITLRVSARGASEEECHDSMKPTIATIHECLGDLIFGEEDDELQHAVLRQLAEKDQTLATAEWGPGGLLSHWLTDVIGDSQQYCGGIVIHSPQMLPAFGIDAAVAEQGGELAKQLADVARKNADSDYGLSVGPFPEIDQGDVHFGLAVRDRKPLSVSAPFTGHPDILKARAVKQALNLLRKKQKKMARE